MIKKIFLIIGAAFLMLVGGSALNLVSANTTFVQAKVTVVSRNVEDHTIKVKTDDDNADTFTLKKVSKAQMALANKGDVVKVKYDDDFNLTLLEKVSNHASYDGTYKALYNGTYNPKPLFSKSETFVLMVAFVCMLVGGFLSIEV